MNNKRFVYGLFDGGECLYVGVTADPKRRARQHKGNKTCGKTSFNLNILKETDWENAPVDEFFFIRKYKRLGQARFNVGHAKPEPKKMKRADTDCAFKIANKIRQRKTFTVATSRERQHALLAAKYLGERIITRACDNGFTVEIIGEATI